MSKKRKSVLVYTDLLYAIDKLTDEEAGIYFKHFLKFINNQSTELTDKTMEVLFETQKSQLQADAEKKEKRCEVNKINAQKSVMSRKDKPREMKPIEERKQKFYNMLIPYVEEFGKETIREFYEYWTEHGPDDRKFRKEKEVSFDISRRLKTFKRNEIRWANNKNNNKVSAAQLLRDEIIKSME